MLAQAVIGILVSAHPVCTCAVGVPAGTAEERPAWFDRGAVFVGTVLETTARSTIGVTDTVHMLVEASWTGPVADTVTLIVGTNAPCAFYVAGSRYLVLADRTPGTANLTAGACDYAWRINSSVTAERLAELGAPAWVPPPYPEREIDRLTVPIGEPSPVSGTLVALAMGFDQSFSVRRVDIANYTWVRSAEEVVAMFELSPECIECACTAMTGR